MYYTILVSGYPNDYKKGKIINGLKTQQILYYFMQVQQVSLILKQMVVSYCNSNLEILWKRQSKSSKDAEKINFEGKKYRNDIVLTYDLACSSLFFMLEHFNVHTTRKTKITPM